MKLVEFDVESMIKQGILGNSNQKSRLAEIIVRDHFKTHPIDLAGENCISPYDGICPNGKIYDVKSSKFTNYDGFLYWRFGTNNKDKDEIEIYYLLAFNEYYTKLEYVWRIPGEIAEKGQFSVGFNSWSRTKFTIMKEYDITDKLIEVLMKNGLNRKVGIIE